MSYRTILEYPNKDLLKKSNPITDFNDDLGLLVQDLLDTCDVEDGAGLAAPQIGVRKRVVVINCEFAECDSPEPHAGNESMWVLVNPQLELSGTKTDWKEACLSVPNTHALVERFSKVKVTYQNVAGDKKQADVEWPLAGMLQHECDHLDGQLYIHKISRLKRRMALKRFEKARRKQRAVLKALAIERETVSSRRTRRTRQRNA